MSLSLDIAKRLREVFLDGQFIANTNYNEQLASVDWQQATYRIFDLNTIAALTFHINYYIEGILSARKTNNLDIKDQYSFDHPPITSENDWHVLRNQLSTNAAKFVEEMSTFDEQQWKEPFFDEKYGSYLRNIEAVLEHSYYHLGQIVLLKKMLCSL